MNGHRNLGWGSAVAAVALALGAAALAQDQGRLHATGGVPADPAVYDAAPRQPLFRSALPTKVDLTAFAPVPKSQGMQGSCTAWATAYAARTTLRSLENQGGPKVEFSPAYIFNQVKATSSTAGSCDRGISIPSALNLLRDRGAVSLSQFPYDEKDCARQPGDAEHSAAGTARIGGWSTLADRDAVRQALAQGRPVVFAMSVGRAFDRWKGPATFRDMTREPSDGLHAMTIVGYDDERDNGQGAFRIQNSWGTWWGDNGLAWLGYDAFDKLARIGSGGRVEAYAVLPRSEGIKPPLDTGAQGLDDRLAAIRDRMSCGSIAWARDVSGKLRVTGYVGSADERGVVSEAIEAAAPGASISLDELAWPQCEVKRRLAGLGSGIEVSLQAGARTANGPASAIQLAEGDFFALRAASQARLPYLTIVYVQADGTAVPLFAGQGSPAGERRLAELGTGDRLMRISGPFGAEAIVAIASDGPVLAELPATGLVERKFLDLLNRRMGELRSSGRPVAASAVLLTTRKAS